MKILFVLENTIQNLEGGTEVSSFHLASLLRKKKVEVEDWVPYKKRRAAFFYTCVWGQLYIFIRLLCDLVKIKPQILHIQGKYLVPPAILAGKILKIPTVATIRDYVVVCPTGLCLFEEGVIKKNHGLGWFIFQEIPRFLSIYHSNKSIFGKVLRGGLMIRGWFVSKYLKWWLKKADKVIAVSEATQRILKENGIRSQVIYNTFDTKLYKDCPLSTEDSPLGKDKKDILFVGKPSYGKGYDLFQSLSRNKLFNKYNFKTIGGKNKLNYLDTLKEIKRALVVVVPSRWPEPFGRVALESIMLGTPVLSTNRGGLPEIVENNATGLSVDPKIKLLSNALFKIIQDNHRFRQNIRSGKDDLLNKFEDVPLREHIKLYDDLLPINSLTY